MNNPMYTNSPSPKGRPQIYGAYEQLSSQQRVLMGHLQHSRNVKDELSNYIEQTKKQTNDELDRIIADMDAFIRHTTGRTMLSIAVIHEHQTFVGIYKVPANTTIGSLRQRLHQRLKPKPTEQVCLYRNIDAVRLGMRLDENLSFYEASIWDVTTLIVKVEVPTIDGGKKTLPSPVKNMNQRIFIDFPTDGADPPTQLPYWGYSSDVSESTIASLVDQNRQGSYRGMSYPSPHPSLPQSQSPGTAHTRMHSQMYSNTQDPSQSLQIPQSQFSPPAPPAQMVSPSYQNIQEAPQEDLDLSVEEFVEQGNFGDFDAFMNDEGQELDDQQQLLQQQQQISEHHGVGNIESNPCVINDDDFGWEPTDFQ